MRCLHAGSWNWQHEFPGIRYLVSFQASTGLTISWPYSFALVPAARGVAVKHRVCISSSKNSKKSCEKVLWHISSLWWAPTLSLAKLSNSECLGRVTKEIRMSGQLQAPSHWHFLHCQCCTHTRSTRKQLPVEVWCYLNTLRFIPGMRGCCFRKCASARWPSTLTCSRTSCCSSPWIALNS